MKITAVIVTYNRKQLLLECLESILNQSRKVDEIILIDNNSTDGTYEELKNKEYLKNKNLIYKKLEKNIGGAGGFYEGLKLANKNNADWVWIMDDDTIPNVDCLENLENSLKNINDKISFLASSIYGPNEEFMNVPVIDAKKSDNGYPDWYKYLGKGIVKIESATFVSLLINCDAIKKIGLPVRDYFIWGDDTEYTLRLTKFYGNAYMIGNSIAIHKRKIAKSLSLYEEDNINRINMNYYNLRNNLINCSVYKNKISLLKLILSYLYQSIKVLFIKTCKYRFKKSKIIMKAVIDFIFKRYDYKAFKNRFDINVEYKRG